MEGCIFIGKAFTNALSWLSGTSQLLKNTVKNEAMVDALWCVYARRLYHLLLVLMHLFNYWYNGLLYTCRREASALLVLQCGQCEGLR